MGISKSSFRLLLEEKKAGHFKGKSILQLGRQHAFLSLKQCIKIADQTESDYWLNETVLGGAPQLLSFNPELAKRSFIDDRTIFSMLGCTTIHSLDIYGDEQPTFIHDLNHEIPAALNIKNQYEIVFDGGTLEHIFNLPQVLKNIHYMLADNGVIIHCSPSHNHVDHGYYMFSPLLLHNYYWANNYKILRSYIFEYKKPMNGKWNVYHYTPGILDELSFGGFGKSLVGIWFVAQKQPHSTCHIIPQQLSPACGPPVFTSSGLRSLKNLVKKIPPLYAVAKFLKGKIKRISARRRCLKHVGKF